MCMLLLTAEAQERRWVEHFEELLNQPALVSKFTEELFLPAVDLLYLWKIDQSRARRLKWQL